MNADQREQQLDDILAAYLEGAANGWAPDRNRLLHCYPKFAPEIERFLSNEDFITDIVAPKPLSPEAGERGARARPRVPGYEILETIGSGGMGIVYKARQAHADRVVALKMLLGAKPSEAERRRFRTEAEAVARLQHPGVVQIHEVGEHDGTPFFSMEYCPGGSLADHLDGTPLPPMDAAKLVELLAQGVQHAHEHGIIHRDLKPANVLLGTAPERRDRADNTWSSTPFSSESCTAWFPPKITDFGLARRLDDDVRQTQSGAIVGTPSYMPPEQASGVRDSIGPATDVYALGAILYELLTGRPPFRGPTPVDTVLQVLRDDVVPVRRLQPKAPRDLETICHRCLEKDPGRRYVTATALADDLGRFVRGEPVAARPVSAIERAWRWCRRSPGVAALLAFVFLTLSTTAVLSVLLAGQEALRRQEALHLAHQEEENAREQTTLREFADAAREATKAQLERARANLLTAQLARVDAIWEREPMRALDLLHDPTACPFELRDPAWRFYERSASRWRLATLRGRTDRITSLAFSPDGKTLASASRDGMVKLWDRATGEERTFLRGPPNWERALAFSPDGKMLAVSGDDPSVRLWDVASGQQRAELPTQGRGITSLTFSPDGKTLGSGSYDNRITLWELATLKVRSSLKGDAMSCHCVIAFSPDGKMLAASPSDGQRIKWWDLTTGQERTSSAGHRSQAPTVLGIAFSPDGKTLACGDRDDNVRLWDVASGKHRTSLHGHVGHVSTVVFSPDGKLLASGAGDGAVKLWDMTTEKESVTLKGHTRKVEAIAFSSDGRTVASGSDDNTIILWDVITPLQRPTLKDQRGPVAFSPDGKTLATVAFGVKLWDVATGRERLFLQGHARGVAGIAFSPDGRTLASASGDKTVGLWDTTTGLERATLAGHSVEVTCVAFSPDGKIVAAGGLNNSVILWEVATQKPLGRIQPVPDNYTFISAVAFSPDSKTLAIGGGSKQAVKLWDVTTLQERIALKAPAGYLDALAFSPDGKMLATAYHGELAVRLWGSSTGNELSSLKGHTRDVHGMAFSPDGKTLASASSDHTLKLWEIATGQERATLRGHTAEVHDVAFSPDGRMLVSASADETVKFWDLGTEKIPAPNDIR